MNNPELKALIEKGRSIGSKLGTIRYEMNEQYAKFLKEALNVNVESTVKLAQAINIPVIASGGITNLDDIRALSEVSEEGIVGAITGRAIYEGTLDFAEGQKLSDELNK